VTSGGNPGQSLAIIPWHPVRRVGGKLLGMPLQLSKVAEGVHIIELGGVNEAHVQIAYLGPIQRFVEERVFAMQNRFL
jgi:hypothetical protein